MESTGYSLADLLFNFAEIDTVAIATARYRQLPILDLRTIQKCKLPVEQSVAVLKPLWKHVFLGNAFP